ncbi:MAG: DUF192 domain-containing protein [Saezia sp.]
MRLFHLYFFVKKSFLILLVFFLFSYSASFAQTNPQTGLERATLTIQRYEIDTQLAKSHFERSKGLMWRASMPENEGMLFIFDAPATQCFWMKNTYLPLSAAFVADNGEIVNIVDMQPLSTKGHCSEKPVRFVLEVHQGWFKKRDLQAGSIVSGLDSFVK